MQYLGSSRSGGFEWLGQRVTGVALVVILAVHFILLHYTGHGPVTYDTVAPRLADPYYKALQMLFLVLGLYHAMNGVKLLIDDYVHSSGWRSFATGLNWVAAIAFFIFGAITILTFSYQAA
jgi:succinate dehydrogenase / fumarate reductase, membrane anchor subunit